MLNNGTLIHSLRLLVNVLTLLSSATCDAADNTLYRDVASPGEAVS